METKAIILGAGMGTRMNSPLPKVLHEICGIPMIRILLSTVEKAGIQDITVVVGPNMDNLKKVVAPYKTVEQKERLGTGHAVLMAEECLKPFDGCVLILFGDSPLLKSETEFISTLYALLLPLGKEYFISENNDCCSNATGELS